MGYQNPVMVRMDLLLDDLSVLSVSNAIVYMGHKDTPHCYFQYFCSSSLLTLRVSSYYTLSKLPFHHHHYDLTRRLLLDPSRRPEGRRAFHWRHQPANQHLQRGCCLRCCRDRSRILRPDSCTKCCPRRT